MGRISDYENMYKRGNEEKYTFDLVKDKFGRESMSAAEFAVYLSEISGFHIDEKTVKNRIKAICEDSGGTLSNDDFREDAADVILKPVKKIQNLFIARSASGFYETPWRTCCAPRACVAREISNKVFYLKSVSEVNTS